jgi:high-affinity Fe2+/Pb2+ permease
LLFVGPVVITSAFKNEKHPLYVYVLVLGIIIGFAAMFLIYKGINTILKSLFDGDKN